MSNVGRTVLLLSALGAASCEIVLAGTLGGDCDPPRALQSEFGGEPETLRRSNCQPAGAVCCRRSATARFTVCSYPEDCFVAPHMGACLTAVDCADQMACQEGTCQCALGGPPCASVDGGTQVTCCETGQTCVQGMCTDPATP